MIEQAPPRPTLSSITTLSTDEMIQLLGWQNSQLGRGLARSLFRPGVAHFARHVLRFENWIHEYGWSQANRLAAGCYLNSLTVSGAERVPEDGPLLITANHPGITDFMAVSAAARRDDLSILAYTRPFLQTMPDLSSHILHLANEPELRFRAIRGIIRRLQNGEAVLTFPAGVGEPDPQVMPGAAGSLENWQPSVGLLVRRVPDLQVIPTLVSGVLSRRALELGIVRRKTSARQKIRLAGTLQVMWQAITGKPFGDVRVDFGPVLLARELTRLGTTDQVLDVIKDHMRDLITALAAGNPARSSPSEAALPVPFQNQSVR